MGVILTEPDSRINLHFEAEPLFAACVPVTEATGQTQVAAASTLPACGSYTECQKPAANAHGGRAVDPPRLVIERNIGLAGPVGPARCCRHGPRCTGKSSRSGARWRSGTHP